MRGQRTATDQIGQGAGVRRFPIVAAVKMPIAFKQRAAAGFDPVSDPGPTRPPVIAHIRIGNLIGYTLKAHGGRQPFKYFGRAGATRRRRKQI